MHPKQLLHSTTFRISLLYVVLFALSVVLLFGFVYWAADAWMQNQVSESIDTEIQGLAEGYDRGGTITLSQLIRDRVERQRPTGTSIYLLTDPAFVPLTGNLDRWPVDGRLENDWVEFDLVTSGAVNGEARTARARTFRLPGEFRLLVGKDLTDLHQMRRGIVRTMIWGLVLTILLGVVVGYFVTRQMTKRLDAVNRACREIMEGDLDRRVPVGTGDDEFRQLESNLNTMLDRISSLLDSVRRVSDNIAHDLKTPLARLRNRLEQARQGDRGDALLILEDAIGDADKLLSTFNALLRIARIESDDRRTAFTRVDVCTLVADVVELYEPVAEEKSVTIAFNSTADNCITDADRDMLFQAVVNLLDNAVKYSPSDGHIEVAVDEGPNRIDIRVRDSGPGIPLPERQKVFQRFYRTDASRTTPGNGLGLSLVQAVAQVHRADLAITSGPPGNEITLTLCPAH